MALRPFMRILIDNPAPRVAARILFEINPRLDRQLRGVELSRVRNIEVLLAQADHRLADFAIGDQLWTRVAERQACHAAAAVERDAGDDWRSLIVAFDELDRL